MSSSPPVPDQVAPNTSLVRPGLFDAYGKQFKEVKRNLKDKEAELLRTVEAGTKDELEAVEKAMAKLFDKEKEVRQSPEWKAKEEAATQAYNQLEKLIRELRSMAQRSLERIQALDVPDERKKLLWGCVAEGIEKVMYSDDERRALAMLQSQVSTLLYNEPGPSRRLLTFNS